MAIHFKCGKCANKMEAPEDFVGREARCGVCGKFTVVPKTSEFSPENTTVMKVKEVAPVPAERAAAPPQVGPAVVGFFIGGIVAMVGGVLGILGKGNLSHLGFVGIGIVSICLGLAERGRR